MNIKSEGRKKRLVLMINCAHGKRTQLDIKSDLGDSFISPVVECN